MDSEFVKEWTSVLVAAEILCLEIIRFLKMSVFFFFLQMRQLIVELFGGR